MLATAKRFYSKMVSILTAIVMACTTAVFTISTASGEDISEARMREMVNELAILVNEEREALGLEPLYCTPYLMECANIRAQESSVYFNHFRPDGSSYTSVLDYDALPWAYIGENLAGGSNTAAGAMQQWKDSPKHWATITRPEYTHMGIGLCYNPDGDGGYTWYWSQLFTNEWDPVEYDGQYLPTDRVIVPADEGDIDGDATISTFDYITLVEYIRKKQEGKPVYLNDAQMEAADCFQDGRITEADAKAMMRYILGEYQSLPYVF